MEKKGRRLSEKWSISTFLIRKWIDHYNSNGIQGLLSNKELSLRDCCLHYNIPSQRTIFSWLRKYEQFDLQGLRESKGRPMVMKKDKDFSCSVLKLFPVQKSKQAVILGGKLQNLYD